MMGTNDIIGFLVRNTCYSLQYLWLDCNAFVIFRLLTVNVLKQKDLQNFNTIMYSCTIRSYIIPIKFYLRDWLSLKTSHFC